MTVITPPRTLPCRIFYHNSPPPVKRARRARRALPPGASIAQVKKLSRPESGGYWDAKVSVRFANGGLGEVIVADANVLDAKMNRGGHDLYDFQRAIENLKDTDELAADLYYDMKQIELAIYAHKTERAAQYQGDAWERAKASALSSLTRFLDFHGRDFISAIDMGKLKELLEGSHLHQPASLDSYATPASSFIQNDIGNTSLLADTADGGNDSINPPVRQGRAAGAQRFSVSPAEDAAYMDAAERGDMATAQRMVREAAARSSPARSTSSSTTTSRRAAR